MPYTRTRKATMKEMLFPRHRGCIDVLWQEESERWSVVIGDAYNLLCMILEAGRMGNKESLTSNYFALYRLHNFKKGPATLRWTRHFSNFWSSIRRIATSTSSHLYLPMLHSILQPLVPNGSPLCLQQTIGPSRVSISIITQSTFSTRQIMTVSVNKFLILYHFYFINSNCFVFF